VDVEQVRSIVAVVTCDRGAVGGGGAPIFYANDEKEKEQVALLLGRLLDGIVHDLGNGTLVVVKY